MLDKDLIYEEAPEAYKDIEEVIQDLSDFGLIRVVARLKPVCLLAFEFVGGNCV
jgi:release factor H-coupled RctB family protein